MKISCLIASYRAGEYIGKALESIRAQEHADWEVVVVEDGSRDETENIVRRFASSVSQPVRYENLGTNQGVSAARNRLLTLAQGEASAFIDADDWWTPRHLTNAANAFAQGADLVVSGIELFDLAANKPIKSYQPIAALYVDPIDTLFAGSAIMTSSCVALRMSLVRNVGEFDRAFRIGEDRDFWLRCAAAGAKFAGTNEVTCYYAKHASSTMAKTLLWAQQEVAFYEKHFGFERVSLAARKRNLAHVLSNYGRLLRATDRPASRKALKKSFALSPKFSTLLQLARSMA
ncbi:MAG TPA: glycosyltransferase family A protein [Opitutaceae bacterium]|nr:glycosyltransferase family A protein [Opitutaceae bacterium]